VVIGNHPFRTAQAPVGEPAQELRPEGLRLGRAVGQGRISWLSIAVELRRMKYNFRFTRI